MYTLGNARELRLVCELQRRVAAVHTKVSHRCGLRWQGQKGSLYQMKHSVVYFALIVVTAVTLSSKAAHAVTVPTFTISAAASTCAPPAPGILFCSPQIG